jgi:hypothetical protein
MPNAYAVKNLAGRPSRPTPIFHRAYYFFNGTNRRIPAFITTPDMYFMNRILKNSTNRRVLKQKLVELTGGEPYGEARSRRMINNTLNERRRIHANPPSRYNTKSHQTQINFYTKLRSALGNGNKPHARFLHPSNRRINAALQLIIKQRMKNAPSKLSEVPRYNAIRTRQNLLMRHIKNSKILSNKLVRNGITPTNTQLRNLSTRRNALGSAIRAFLNSRNALRLNASKK